MLSWSLSFERARFLPRAVVRRSVFSASSAFVLRRVILRVLGGGDMFDDCESDLRFLCACAVEFETVILFCVFRFSFWGQVCGRVELSARARAMAGSLW